MEINEELARKCVKEIIKAIHEENDSAYDLIHDACNEVILNLEIGADSLPNIHEVMEVTTRELLAALTNHCTMEARIIPSQVEKT